jgi:CHAT domain-containing protein
MLLRTLRSAESRGEGVVFVGGVDYGHGTHGAWDPLPGTREDRRVLENVTRRSGERLTAVSGRDATAAQVRDVVKGARIVHLATHSYATAIVPTTRTESGTLRSGWGIWSAWPEKGRVELGRSPQAQSGLVLAGANESSEGLVSIGEVAGWDLSEARLVVLAVCASGRGPDSATGVVSLRDAIHAAGARAVLSSLWPVPDESTAALMRAFYETLWEGRTIAESLYRAQEKVRASWPARLHWAGWSLSGDVFR